MRKQILAVIFMALCPLLAAQQALNNDAVIKLVKAGLSDDLIVTTINSAAGSYDTSVDGLIALKSAGVSDKIVAAIVTKASASGLAPAAAPASAASAVADPNDPASPHDPGVYLMLSGADGKPKMVRIEQSDSNTDPPRMSTSVKAKIPESHAALRTAEARPVTYLYFPSTSGITDAASPSQFTLLTLWVKKDHREAEVAHLKPAAGGYVYVTGLNKSELVHSTAVKVRPGVFKVTPDADLPQGEYAFIATTKLDETGAASFFAFGVDVK